MLQINEYIRPETLNEALEALAQPEKSFKILAGGTDLVIALEKATEPSNILDVGLLKELKEIREEKDGVFVGAAATFTEVENSEIVKRFFPPLAKAASLVGSPQIRNAGTVGGNMANASPAADTVPPVVAFDGDVILASKGAGEYRQIPATQFLKGINKTDIAKDELMIGIFVRKMDSFSWGLSKLGRRKALAIARLSCVIGLEIGEDGIVTDTRVALGAVAPNPFRSKIIEDALKGVNTKDADIETVLKHASKEVEERIGTRPSMPYKRGSIQGLVQEAYYEALKKGGR